MVPLEIWDGSHPPYQAGVYGADSMVVSPKPMSANNKVHEVHEDTPFNAQEHVKRVKTPSELSSELSTPAELSTNLRDLHVRPLDQSRCGRHAAHRARIVRVSWRNTRPRSSRRCSVARTTCALRATPRASGFSRSMGVQTAHGLLLGGMEARTVIYRVSDTLILNI